MVVLKHIFMHQKQQKQTYKSLIQTSIIAGLGGTLFYLLISFNGIGISPDSVSYLATAKNIASGKGITDYNNSPLVLFPAGYPLFLGFILKLTGCNLLTIAKVINATLMISLVFFYGLIIDKFKNKNTFWLYKLIILISIPISASMLDVYTMLWSETLFIVLIPVFVLLIYRYLQIPTIANLLIVALISAIACDVRIAGISIIGTGLAIIALQNSFTIKKKLRDCSIYFMLSSSIIVLNIIRNNFLSGSMAGIRQKSETSFFANIDYVGNTILQWFHLIITFKYLGLLLGISVMSLLLGIILWKLLLNKTFSSIELITTLFCFFYFGFIILSSTLSKYEPINNRLLSPAFVPFLISITLFIPNSLSMIRRTIYLKYMIVGIVTITTIFFEYGQLEYCVTLFDETKESGIPGYTEKSWQESNIVQFLTDKKQVDTNLSSEIPIYSNAADAVYFYSSRNATNLPETAHTTKLSDYCGSGTNYIVWFTNEFDYKAIVRLEDISLHRYLDTLKSFKDGYLLISKPFLR